MRNNLLRLQCPLARTFVASYMRRGGVGGSDPFLFLRLGPQKLPSATTISPTIRFASSSSSNTDNGKDGKDKPGTIASVASNDQSVFERTVYVHPLSQIILEHLQDAHHPFLVTQKLDTGLTLNRDGSFELKFPMTLDENAKDDVHRIWTSYDEVEKKHWLTIYRGPTLQERFLLQDNLLPAWNNNRKSLPERIHVAVDQMIRRIKQQTA